jgi:hypothetical protein
MTNINLLPCEGMTLADIVADTDDGLYLPRTAVEHGRPAPNFQFATEAAYDQGRQARRAVKNPTYTGIDVRFWRPATPSQTPRATCSTSNRGGRRWARSVTWGTARGRASGTSRSGSARQSAPDSPAQAAARGSSLGAAAGATQAEVSFLRR